MADVEASIEVSCCLQATADCRLPPRQHFLDYESPVPGPMPRAITREGRLTLRRVPDSLGLSRIARESLLCFELLL